MSKSQCQILNEIQNLNFSNEGFWFSVSETGEDLAFEI